MRTIGQALGVLLLLGGAVGLLLTIQVAGTSDLDPGTVPTVFGTTILLLGTAAVILAVSRWARR